MGCVGWLMFSGNVNFSVFTKFCKIILTDIADIPQVGINSNGFAKWGVKKAVA